MKLVHFTFNNFFDYLIIAEQLQIKAKLIFNPSESIIIFTYTFTAEYAIDYIEGLCKPLDIQFTTTLGISEDTEGT